MKNIVYYGNPKGNLILYEYPNRPKDMPIDNSNLLDKYVLSEKKGNNRRD